MYSKVVAIDGPSGVGKSSVAKMLAKELGALHVDTGSMYRALAYRASQMNLDLQEPSQCKNFLSVVRLEYAPSDGSLIRIDGEDCSGAIRSSQVTAMAGKVARIAKVREFLVSYQRSLVCERLCVMEGRDIGTVVFPDAFAKFFLTASSEVRAERRFKELSKQGSKIDLKKVLEDVVSRDKSDIEREHSPLLQADDAEEVDTGNMALEEVVETLSRKTRQRANDLEISI